MDGDDLGVRRLLGRSNRLLLAGIGDLAKHTGQARADGSLHAVGLNLVEEMVLNVADARVHHDDVDEDVNPVADHGNEEEELREALRLLEAVPVVLRQVMDEVNSEEGHDDAERLERVDRRLLAHAERLATDPGQHVLSCREARLLERNLSAALDRALRQPLHATLERLLADTLGGALAERLAHVHHDPLRRAESGLLDPAVLQLVLGAVQRVFVVVVAVAAAVAVAVAVALVARARAQLRVGGLPGGLAGLLPLRLAGRHLRRRRLHRILGRLLRTLRHLERRQVRRPLLVQPAAGRGLLRDRLLQRHGGLVNCLLSVSRDGRHLPVAST
mmetsp:Transcript_2328/g.6917  ORF Transcript_2328/g.6917 Transcript_2328/m.6917 type:complete len:331 (-) Transcript_2328:40-1032(-)